MSWSARPHRSHLRWARVWPLGAVSLDLYSARKGRAGPSVHGGAAEDRTHDAELPERIRASSRPRPFMRKTAQHGEGRYATPRRCTG